MVKNQNFPLTDDAFPLNFEFLILLIIKKDLHASFQE